MIVYLLCANPANSGSWGEGELQLTKSVADTFIRFLKGNQSKKPADSAKKLPTIIFDEIDSGVSGKISNSIADIMYELSVSTQVFTITHLPQVASKGNNHFKVFKNTNNLKTNTYIKQLSKKERVEEIAMMLSGNKITDTAKAHAKQLLN